MGLHRLMLSSDGGNSTLCHAAGSCSPPKPASRHLTNLFIASGCFVAVAFFLALTYYAVVGHLWRRRRALAEPGADDRGAVDETERGHGHGHDHVWFVSGAGLDAATIESIAAFEYKAGDGLLAGATADCSVCLAEFRDGELLRLLPKCGHAFHLPCIDTWLHGHVSCPLCRAHIAAKPAAEEDSAAPAVSGVSGSEAAPVSAEVEAEDSRAEDEIGQPKSSSCPPSRVPSDIGGGSQPVRRWVSMISVHHGGGDLPIVEQGNSSKEATIQQKDRPEGEKSMILFSKKNGISRSSILPL